MDCGMIRPCFCWHLSMDPNYIAAIILGIIEGVTEFLPISSTGHLLIAQHWMGRQSDLFNIAIQAGAILAVAGIYRDRIWALMQAFLGLSPKPIQDDSGQFTSARSVRIYGWKIAIAFLVTCVIGLTAKAFNWNLPDEIRPIAWTLIIGAIWMLVAEYFAEKRAQRTGIIRQIAWKTAVLVGIAQAIAGIFPGTSRSAATIFVALLAGTTSRAAATEFAFLVGIPTMLAATGYEFLDVMQQGNLANEDWVALSIAFSVSAVTAFFANQWLLTYIKSHKFTWFSLYRIVLGIAILAFMPVGS